MTDSAWPTARVFYGYSGPSNRPDGFDVWCSRAGARFGINVDVFMADITNGINLADELFWDKVKKDLAAEDGYLASLWSPPCGTFSLVREIPGGPPPLRGAAGPELYGLKGLSLQHKEQVRMGTLLAIRSAEGVKIHRTHERPFILENPAMQPGRPSLFNLPEIVDACGPEAFSTTFYQCSVGAKAPKPTGWLSSFKLPVGPLDSCSHPKVWWRLPPMGEWIFQSHAPLKGRYQAVPPEVWDMMNLTERHTPEPNYLTKSASAYPSELNAYLAVAIVEQLAKRLVMQVPGAPVSMPMRRAGKFSNALVAEHLFAAPWKRKSHVLSLPSVTGASGPSVDVFPDEAFECKRRPTFAVPLKPQQRVDAREAAALAIGGMRQAQRSVARLPSLAPVGQAIRQIVTRALQKSPQLLRQCLDAIGRKDPDEPNADFIHEIRRQIGTFLNVSDLGQVRSGDFSTEIRAALLEGWRERAQDPDWAVTQWLLSAGVPAGLRRHPEDCGIFPRTDDQGTSATDLDSMAFEDTGIYHSVEADDDAWAEIQRYVSRGWLRQFDTEEDLASYLGESPVLSRFGLVVKVKGDTIKKRLILDAKVSGVSGVASKLERVLLPRLLDVAQDILRLQTVGPDVELFILDFADAFWLMPLARCERRWFTARLRGKFFVYLRNAQGSRNAPIGWGRIAALIGRLTQSMFNKEEARTEIYTDDPCITVQGTKGERDLIIATIIVVWLCLGLPLSWKKGSRGVQADWIGGEFVISQAPLGVQVRIKQSLFDEAAKLVKDMLSLNVVSVKALQSLVGKLSNIANLLVVWRPFLAPLFAALYAPTASGAPPNCVWVKQISSELSWFQAFFSASGGFVERHFDLQCFTATDTIVDVVLDASPWGLAGVLTVNDQPVEFFAEAITPHDVDTFDHTIGDAAGQQVWECLAALIAVRLWRNRWQKHQVCLRIRGDSVAMLTLLVNMRPHSAQMRLIAQEIAIDMAHYTFVPVIAQHIPGIANVVADELSRWAQPGHVQKLPHYVQPPVTRVFPPSRNHQYYLTKAGLPSPSRRNKGDIGASSAS